MRHVIKAILTNGKYNNIQTCNYLEGRDGIGKVIIGHFSDLLQSEIDALRAKFSDEIIDKIGLKPMREDHIWFKQISEEAARGES